MKTTHIISAVYFPNAGEVDATWEDAETCERVGATFKVPPEIGYKIAKIVPPCVYTGATKDIKHLDTIEAAVCWYLCKREDFFTYVATKSSRKHDGSEFTEQDLQDAREKKNEAKAACAYVMELKLERKV